MLEKPSIVTAVAAALIGWSTWAAAEPPRTHMKVIGSVSTTNQYRNWERPFFAEKLPAMSGGQVTADILGQDESGIKGPEVLRLLRLGVLDVARGVLAYMAGENSAFEGLDLAGLTGDLATAREATAAYRPVIESLMAEQFDTKLLTLHPVSMQTYYCRDPIEQLSDLEGRKVRVSSVTLEDFVGAVGASAVTIPFVEVVPALQRGVADCGITGTSNGNTSRWWEVTDHLYAMNMTWAMTFYAASLDFWNGLDPEVRDIMTQGLAQFEDDMWAQAEADVQDGINCNTGGDPCVFGVPAEPPMVLVIPSEEDEALRKEILQETVVPAWAARCGSACAETWNETVGSVVGVTAPAL